MPFTTRLAVALTAPLTFAVAFAVPATAQQQTYEGSCMGKAKWFAYSDPRGTANASLMDCSDEEPPTYLSIDCKRGSRTLNFYIDYHTPSGVAGQARQARFSIDGEPFTFAGSYDPTGMYSLLNFKSARAARFLEALQAGQRLTIFGGDGQPAVYSLTGSRKAVGFMLAKCHGEN